MSPDRLAELLREAETPPSDAVRERVVAAARAKIAGRTPAPRRRPARPRRRLVVLLAAGLLGIGLLTPPGRAAIDKAAELVGIGDVGGSPSLRENRARNLRRTSSPVVVDNGRAPDGGRYEWVAYRAGRSYRVGNKRVRYRWFCVNFEWPDSQRGGGGGYCFTGTPSSGPPPGLPPPKPGLWQAFESLGVSHAPTTGARKGAVMVSGTTRPGAHRMRILYTDARGRSRALRVDFARVDGSLLRRAGGPRPFGTFVAFVPAAQAERDRLSQRFHLSQLTDPPPVPSRPIPETPFSRCLKRHGYGSPRVSPFEIVVYGRAGQLIGREHLIEARPAPRSCRRLPQRPATRAARESARRKSGSGR